MKRKAIFTIVHNEQYFLPLWLNYYTKYFDNKDIYVLDDTSTDNSTKNLKVNVINIDNKFSFNHGYMLDTVKKFQSKLLEEYDVVVFVEVDEFIIPTNMNLGEYIENMNGKLVRCTGWDIIHNYNLESSLDLTKPIMPQRVYGCYNVLYSKSLISTISLNWTIGFHDQFDQPETPNLFLLHFHYFDLDVAFKRLYERLQRGINTNESKVWGHENKILETKENFIKTYFQCTSILPEKIKTLDV